MQTCYHSGHPVSISGQVPHYQIRDVHRILLGSIKNHQKREIYLNDVAHLLEQEGAEVSRQYLQVARPFFKVNLNPSKLYAGSITCARCTTPYVLEEDKLTCPKCDHVLVQKVEHQIRNVNVPKEMRQFLKTIDFLEGKIKLPGATQTDLFAKLDMHFAQHDVPTRSTKDSLPLFNGERQGTSMEHMMEALRQFGKNLTNYANYICNEYWGWTPISIASVRGDVIDKEQSILEGMEGVLKKHGRRKPLGPWFMLYQLLVMSHFAINIDYFHQVKTQLVQNKHMQIWTDCCRQALVS